MMTLRRICLVLALAVGLTAPAAAQYPLNTIGSILPATASGSLTAAEQSVPLNLLGFPGAAVQVTGTFVGTLAFEVSVDGTNYVAVNMTPPSSSTPVTTTTATGVWSGSTVGFRFLRVRMSAHTSGTAVVTARATLGGGSGGGGGTVTFDGEITATPTGSAGSPNAAVVSVQGISGGTVLPVSAASLPLPSGAATSANQSTANTTLSSINGKITTVNTDSVVVSSSALPTGAATAANQSTSNTSLSSITSHVSRLTSSAEGIAPGTVGATTSLLVGGIYNSTPPTFTNGQRGALQFDANGNLKVSTSGGGSNAAASSTGSAVPSSASYTGLNIGGNLTGWTGFSLGSARAGAMAIVDGSGNQITSFGGGTQYATGAAQATPTGTVALGFDGTNVRALATNSTGNLQVSQTNGVEAGTAGTASADVISVQGIADMTPIQVSGTILTQLLTEMEAVKDSLLTIQSTLSVDATEDEPETPGKPGPPVLSVRRDAPASSAGTTGDYATLNTAASGALWVANTDPCSSEEKITTPISLTTDTVIIAATSGKKNYICSITLVAAAAEIVSITEGTGTVCGTSEAALLGSTTDANGLSFAANGGFSAIASNSTVLAGKTANVDTCLNVSGTNRVSGFVTWVQR